MISGHAEKDFANATLPNEEKLPPEQIKRNELLYTQGASYWMKKFKFTLWTATVKLWHKQQETDPEGGKSLP